MGKAYMEPPHNIGDIEKYVVCDKVKAADLILTSDICFIYDACAIIIHAKFSNIIPLLSYIKRKNGIVIITRTVLMEICSGDNMIWDEHIVFIKKLSDAGIKVLIFDEKDSLQCLRKVFNCSGDAFNSFLKHALRIARKWKGSVDEIIGSSGSDTIRKLCGDDNRTKTELFSTFFHMARAKKKPGDNLAEELFMILIAILSNIPDRREYKYIIFGEDRGAIRKLLELSYNLEKHTGAKKCSLLTIPAFCQALIKEKLINQPELQSILDLAYKNKIIKILCSEEYDLKPKEKDFNQIGLMDRLLKDIHFIVYY